METESFFELAVNGSFVTRGKVNIVTFRCGEDLERLLSFMWVTVAINLVCYFIQHWNVSSLLLVEEECGNNCVIKWKA